MLTFENLVEEFHELGGMKGDVLFIHSSYKSFGGVEGGPQTVISALLDVIGVEGTLIMPTFNYDFLKGVPWDIRNTPSQMGVLTEIVRTDPRARCMHHAIYSVSAIRKLADEVAAHRSDDCFGETTIFGKFREWDAKILILGLPYSKSITFLHHCEQAAGVDYRFLKDFKGTAIDMQGKPHEVSYSMFVRDVERGVVLDFEPIGALLDKQVVAIRKVGLGDVRLMKCNQVFDVAVKAMREHKGPGLTYIIETPDRARDWIPPMKPIPSLKDVLAEIVPLHRTLASDGLDAALEIVGAYLPENAN